MESKKTKISDRELKELYGQTLKDDRWFGEHIEELAKEHAGEHVAIIDEKAVAYGMDFGEAYDHAKEAFPGKIPLVAYIPKKGDEMLLV
ncbi:hypothetical protein BEH94_10830 [Candidatus Altiarchaeales archaeon WOR_SM1_SCG]|nr:hypothetical protein BEH94_10830 [Candidatus Altiarchaeales archaeon WOR_SM1_SCG]